MAKYIETAAQAKNALARLVKADGKMREELLTYGEYIAEQSLIHGNKQPYQMAESSGLAKWAVAALKRCILPQNVEYREKREEAREVATAHADKVFGMVLDKKRDDSEAAQKRRADAKAKREAEKKRIAALEAENAKLKKAGATAPATGKKIGTMGGAIVDPTGKVELTMNEDEHKKVLAYLKALRKPAPKAVEAEKEAATA